MQKFDEMYAMLPFDGSDVREHYKRYAQWLSKQPPDVMQARRAEAEMIFRRVGITFAVYGAKDEGGAGNERLIPFDLIPRIIPAHEWSSMQQGLVQRVTALNRFIHDVYHGQDIIKAGILPVAIEFMDRPCIRATEAFAKAGYPDCEALLIVEVEGSPAEIDEQLARIKSIAERHNPMAYRESRSEDESELGPFSRTFGSPLERLSVLNRFTAVPPVTASGRP